MNKWTFLSLLILLPCFGISCSAEEDAGIQGKPFPDFITDKTAVPEEKPAPLLTAAIPLAASRDVHVDNPDAKEIFFHNDTPPSRLAAYIVNDSTAHVRMDLSASDHPYTMSLYDWNDDRVLSLMSLRDENSGGFVLDVPMPDAEDEVHYARICLYDAADPDSSETVDAYLIEGEEYLDELCGYLANDGWELTDENEDAAASQAQPQSYVLHAADQYGGPVPDVMMNFCTDTACYMAKGDESGTIVFDGKPGVYHAQILKVPEGWRFDPDFDLYTGDEYGEWMLYLLKE